MKPRGFFIPYRYAGDLPPRPSRGAYPEIETLLGERHDVFLSVLREIDRHAADLRAFRGQPAGTPRWTQDWFPRLDGAAAYAIVRSRKPRRIVEIGSGHSTRFLACAALDEGIDCRILAVDPEPRASLSALPGVRHVAATLQDLLAPRKEEKLRRPGFPLDDISSGDILFVDSSHILMPGSDVDLLLNRVLPRLPPGVLVHVHDIFLPDDYPPSWGWRGYNEQLGVAPLLTMGEWDVLFASWYVASRMPEALSDCAVSTLPLPPGAPETSLWLIKRGKPALTLR